MSLNIIRREIPANITLDDSLHPLIQRIYLGRGITKMEQVKLGLDRLHAPSELNNIDHAVQILYEHMVNDGRILIVGDFDADGATSSALMVLLLRAMGCRQVDYLVPNRFEYGYGLSPEIVDVARERKPDLIVTVDNGISSHAGIERANALGITVLVTDHHLPGDSLPPAAAIVNPNLPDCGFPSKALAGVGVAFYLLTALRARLRDSGWFAAPGRTEPRLADFLDIVALGTVADVVPLDRNNRCLVAHGLRVLRSGRGRPGIRALLEVAGRNPASAGAAELGFVVGPRLNAAGRLDDISLGIECLLCEDPQQALTLAGRLDAINRDRRQIEQSMQEEALQALQLAVDEPTDQPGICLFRADWHQGVIGIVAARLKERYHRPAIVFADGGVDEQGESLIKGSARSIQGLHMRDLLDLVDRRVPGMMLGYGGHAMAAGLTLRAADFEQFREGFWAELDHLLTPDMLTLKRYSDGELPDDCLNLPFVDTLLAAGPWGQHFPEPAFHGEFKVLSSRVVGQKHLKLVLSALDSDVALEAIYFNAESDYLESAPECVQLYYRLGVNEYRGQRSVQMMVEAMASMPIPERVNEW